MAIFVECVLPYAGDFQRFPVAVRERPHQIAVHPSDELDGNLLWTNRATLAMIRATAEIFVGHGGYHAERALVALGLTLWQRVEMSNFGGGEKHRGRIRTGGNAGTTADARSRVKRGICRLLCDQNRVGTGRTSRRRSDEAARLYDPVKGGPVHHQVSDYGKGASAPRFERQRVAILEEAHGELAYRGSALTAMGHAIDKETARAADSLPAVMLKGNGRFAPVKQILVEGIEHFQKGHIRRHVFDLIGDELARCVCVLLSPNLESDVHGYL